MVVDVIKNLHRVFLYHKEKSKKSIDWQKGFLYAMNHMTGLPNVALSRNLEKKFLNRKTELEIEYDEKHHELHKDLQELRNKLSITIKLLEDQGIATEDYIQTEYESLQINTILEASAKKKTKSMLMTHVIQSFGLGSIYSLWKEEYEAKLHEYYILKNTNEKIPLPKVDKILSKIYHQIVLDALNHRLTDLKNSETDVYLSEFLSKEKHIELLSTLLKQSEQSSVDLRRTLAGLP